MAEDIFLISRFLFDVCNTLIHVHILRPSGIYMQLTGVVCFVFIKRHAQEIWHALTSSVIVHASLCVSLSIPCLVILKLFSPSLGYVFSSVVTQADIRRTESERTVRHTPVIHERVTGELPCRRAAHNLWDHL